MTSTGTTVVTRAPAQTAQEQIEKLSTDLNDAYEALTLVYRTVSSLGSLFRLDDITAYLVNRAVEASEASRAGLYLGRVDGSFDLVSERGGISDCLESGAVRRFADVGKPVFHSGSHAAEFLTGKAPSGAQIMAAPLETGGRVLGVLVLLRDGDERFTTSEAKLVGALCGLTAVAVANFQHYRAVSYERAMLEGVIREIGDGIVIADREWRLHLTNAAARGWLGVTTDDPEGYDVLDRLASFELSTDAAKLRAAKDEAPDFLAMSRDARRPLVLECKLFRAFLGAEGERILVLRMRDVTREHREAEAQRDFMSIASHKLRTPLAKIMGLLPLARDPSADIETRDYAFTGIEQGTDELARLVDGVLRFVEFRQGERVIENVELRPLIEQCAAAVRERRSDKNVEMRLLIDPAATSLRGSRKMLQSLFENLLDNAAKFTPGRVVHVEVEVTPIDARRLRIRVSDHGEGVAPELLKRLFTPFSQRDTEFTGQSEGPGLGLLLVREAVERHGGRLFAESTLGIGTRFTAEIRTAGDPA